MALAPDSGAVISSLVPVMAPSRRSPAAFTQLRREMRWPDVVVLDDCLPLAALMGGHPPVVLRISTGSPRRSLQQVGAKRLRHISAVVVADDRTGERVDLSTFAHAPVCLIRAPYDHRLVSSERVDSARRAARRQLGIGDDDIAVILCDQLTGSFIITSPTGAARDPLADLQRSVSRINVSLSGADESVEGGVESSTARFVVPRCDDPEILSFAADVAIVRGTGTPGTARSERVQPVPAALIDLMAIGVVPVCSESNDHELLVGDRTMVLVSGSNDEVGDEVVTALTDLGRSPEHFRWLSEQARVTARALCDPDVVHGLWSQCLSEALPSLT